MGHLGGVVAHEVAAGQVENFRVVEAAAAVKAAGDKQFAGDAGEFWEDFFFFLFSIFESFQGDTCRYRRFGTVGLYRPLS